MAGNRERFDMTHPTITKEQVDALLKTLAPVREPEFWTKLCQAVYKLGRNAGLEAAKQHVLHANEECVGCPDGPDEFAASIESLKDNTP